ncbi:MAG: NfeD family protein [Mariprofundaceae bacterium]|nr:NfeD family protein [Mariprofundaceae bacterium]
MTVFHTDSWQVWIIITCIIAIIELTLINSYYLLAIAFAASLAGLSAWFDASMNIQWFTFILGSIIALVTMHTLRPSSIKKDKDDISHIIGKTVTIIEDVSPRGRAMYKSVGWAAESDDVLHIGESARIVRVHGSTLYLEAIKEH